MFTQPSWRPIPWEDIFSVNKQGPARRAGLRGCLLGGSRFGVMCVYDTPVMARLAGNDGVIVFLTGRRGCGLLLREVRGNAGRATGGPALRTWQTATQAHSLKNRNSQGQRAFFCDEFSQKGKIKYLKRISTLSMLTLFRILRRREK